MRRLLSSSNSRRLTTTTLVPLSTTWGPVTAQEQRKVQRHRRHRRQLSVLSNVHQQSVDMKNIDLCQDRHAAAGAGVAPARRLDHHQLPVFFVSVRRQGRRLLSSHTTENKSAISIDDTHCGVRAADGVASTRSRTTNGRNNDKSNNRISSFNAERLLEETRATLQRIEDTNVDNGKINWDRVGSLIQKWGRFNHDNNNNKNNHHHQRRQHQQQIKKKQTKRCKETMDDVHNNDEDSISYVEAVDRLMALWVERSMLVQPASSSPSTTSIDTGNIPQPDSEAYKNIIIFHSKSGVPGAAERSEFWLQQMIEASSSSSSSLSTGYPNTVHPPRGSLYAVVLSAWEREVSTSLPTRPIQDEEEKGRYSYNIPVAHGERLFQQWQNDRHRRRRNHLLSDPNFNSMEDDESPNGIQSMYYLLLSIYAKSNHPDGPEKAEALLREMIEMGRKNVELAPSIVAFVNVISAWTKKLTLNSDGKQRIDTVPSAAMKAHDILNLLVEEYIHRQSMIDQDPRNVVNAELKLNEVPFNATIQAWAVSGLSLSEIHRRIDDILLRMKELNVTPTTVTVSNAMSVYDSRTFDSILVDSTCDDRTLVTYAGAPSHIRQLLGYVQNSSHTKPSVHQLYDRAIDIMLREMYRSRNSVENRHEITSTLQEICQKYLDLPITERRTRTTMKAFEAVLDALRYVSSDALEGNGLDDHTLQRQQQQRILHYLQKMEDEAIRINECTSTPSVFCHLSRAWASCATVLSQKDRPFDGALNAIDLFLAACLDHRTNLPKAAWFRDIIDAVRSNYSTRSDSQHSPQQSVCDEFDKFVKDVANKLAGSSQFYRMLHSAQATRYDPPDIMLLHSILDALVQQSENNPKAAKRAELILLAMQDLNLNGLAPPPTFNELAKVITCQLNSQNNLRRANELLDLAETLYQEGDVDMRPTYASYMSVVDAWSNCEDMNAPEEVQKHLRAIQKHRLEGSDDFQSPDSRSYAALIRSFANSGRLDARDRAESVFKSTPVSQKTTDVYNALISAQNGDVSRAELLVHEMHNDFMNGNENVKPDTESFNSVLAQWLQSGSPMAAWRADGIFKRMQQLSESGELQCAPNTKTFDLVISTLAQDWVQSNPLKVDRYLALLKQHFESGKPDCYPSVTSYNEAIRAWGSNVDDPRSVLRAKALLDEMHELARNGVDTVRPNQVTYQVYLESLSRSCPERRAELIDDFLRELKVEHVVLDKRLESIVKVYQSETVFKTTHLEII